MKVELLPKNKGFSEVYDFGEKLGEGMHHNTSF